MVKVLTMFMCWTKVRCWKKARPSNCSDSGWFAKFAAAHARRHPEDSDAELEGDEDDETKMIRPRSGSRRSGKATRLPETNIFGVFTEICPALIIHYVGIVVGFAL